MSDNLKSMPVLMMPSPSRVSTSSKGLKVLGLSANDIVSSFLDGPKKGFLDADEFMVFWQELGTDYNESDNTEFFRSCLELLLMTIEGKKEIMFPMHSLINTISFLSFRSPIVTGDDRLRKTMTDIKMHRTDKGHFSAADEIIRTVQKRLVEDERSLDTLVIQMSTLYSAQELTILSDFLHYPSLDGTKVTGGELSFVYFHLRTLALRDDETRKELLHKIISMFKSLSQTLKLSPMLAQTKMLALLHFVREMIMTRPILDSEFCSMVMANLRCFLAWPINFSSAVQKVLVMVQQEYRSPGVSFIERIVEEYRVRTVSQSLHSDNSDIFQRQTPAYYIIDSNSRLANQWFLVMKLQNLDNVEKFSYPVDSSVSVDSRTQASIILWLFQHYLGAVTADEIEPIRKCNDLILENAFTEVLSIVRDATVTKENGFVCANTKQRVEKMRELLLHQHEFSSPKTSLMDKDLTLDCISSLPPMIHLAYIDSVRYKKPLNGAPQQIMYPLTPTKRRLIKLLSDLQTTKNTDTSSVLRLVCAGGDRILHITLCAYLSIQQETPELLRNVNVHWYIVPFEDSFFASFIARHDGWYNRHLYTPFRARPFVLPFLNTPNVDFLPPTYTAEKMTPPGEFFRECVESYLREAHETVPLQVFQIEAWENADSFVKRSKPDIVIPFVTRVEISARVEARHYQTINNDTRKLQEIIKAANLSFPQLRIHYTKMNLARETTLSVRHDNIVFDGIVLANVPIAKDPCFPADPSQPWLEMYAQLHVTSSTKKVRSSSEQRCRVSMIEISAPMAFSVLVDSSCFGPFYRIMISSHEQKIPIRTFFPVRTL